ncbi:MAG: phosphoenolpyruvate carboxylase [Halioglobus sp.]|nr:phosphoenolpyruvate carboxylase [Halioglobus sp.]
MAEADYASLRGNVSFLGRLLGEVIAEAEGEQFLQLIERIRHLSRAARDGDESARGAMLELLEGLSDDELVPVARAFSQFLNLANIAEQRHHVSREMDPVFSASSTLSRCFDDLAQAAVPGGKIEQFVDDLSIELVLTAHPTEITRRTLIHKHGEISACLGQLELEGHTPRELRRIHERLRDLVTQIWYGLDFREQRPTPVDEARWGFAVVEESLWRAVPEYLRRLDSTLQAHDLPGLPLDAAPVRFAFWMGSDRDGNPNVTAAVTEEVLLLARWQAADLYLKDINTLIEELSMSRCSAALRERAGDHREPYRAVLRPLRRLLRRTLRELERRLDGKPPRARNILEDERQLWEPLQACYASMLDCGMGATARHEVLDVLRRVRCFGVYLVRFDVRQESGRHAQALDEITRCLGQGSYLEWDELRRRQFLLAELATPRPLLPLHWEPSAETREVLDTCAVIGRQRPGALGAYVISMARDVSDVLAVQVLLKAAGCERYLPVAPLFETLDDLENASAVMTALLDEPVYRGLIDNRQMVMIGYSDSSKDAGVLAASWAQYRAQEAVLAVCRERGVDLTLFHGRGGTIGRGGAPAYEALLSQPPGTLRQGLRVTEQGEMIRAKLGLTSQAVKTLALYTSAIARANLLDPPAPADAWRAVMDRLAQDACKTYRAAVRDHPGFVDYFRHATPERELGDLPLGSRPARRKQGGGIESLRAIPWIFAWMQNRLMLPAWLGTGSALRAELDNGGGDTLREMARGWPFFAALLSMQRMVFVKADAGLSAYYDKRLVPEQLAPIGEELRALLLQDAATLEQVAQQGELNVEQRWARESIALRNIYTDPLNYLQVESLLRKRRREDNRLDLAVMVTIAGIAAGMRNTG